MNDTASRFGTWTQAALFSGGLVVAALVAFYFIKLEPVRQEIARGPADLAREIASCRKDGIPVDLQEIRPPVPPVSQNAGPDYERLFTLLKMNPDGIALDKIASSLSVKSSSKDIAAARKAFHNRQDIVQLIHRAADKPFCFMESAWADDIPGTNQALTNNLSIFRAATRILSGESFLLAHDGHSREAIQNEGRVFHIAEHVSSCPGILPYLAGLACEAMALRGTQIILNMCAPNKEAAELTQKIIREPRPHLTLAWAFKTEAANSMALIRPVTGKVTWFQQSVHGALPKENSNAPFWTHSTHTLIREDWTEASAFRILRRMHQMALAAREPLPERLAAFKAIGADTQQEHIEIAGSRLGPVIHATSILSDITTLGYKDLDLRGAQMEAREAVTLSGAAILAYRATHGHFLDRLETAISPAPTDPFTEKPLRYRLEPDGFVVYSLGEKGTFGGGSPGMTPDWKQPYFRYDPRYWGRRR